jgi:hypothetical protein
MCFGENKMSNAIKKIYAACEMHGAYEVRKAAIRWMNGDNTALENVGLDDCIPEFDAFTISDIAFSQMTAREKEHDFLAEYGLLELR